MTQDGAAAPASVPAPGSAAPSPPTAPSRWRSCCWAGTATFGTAIGYGLLSVVGGVLTAWLGIVVRKRVHRRRVRA